MKVERGSLKYSSVSELRVNQSESGKSSNAKARIKLAQRLTLSQLGYLFKRLDVNGDNTIDQNEFFSVAEKLDMVADKDHLIKIFNLADTSSNI
jgi:hypothetical protein